MSERQEHGLNLCEECWDEFERFQNREELLGCVGIGGRTRTVTTTQDLGRGGRPQPVGNSGVRRAAWDLAFGYVSGFRKRDIAYWVLTRSLSRRVYRQTLKFEARHGSQDARRILAGEAA